MNESSDIGSDKGQNGRLAARKPGRRGPQQEVTKEFKRRCSEEVACNLIVMAKDSIRSKIDVLTKTIKWEPGRNNRLYTDFAEIIDIHNRDVGVGMEKVQPGFLQRFFYDEDAFFFNGSNVDALATFLYGCRYAEWLRREDRRRHGRRGILVSNSVDSSEFSTLAYSLSDWFPGGIQHMNYLTGLPWWRRMENQEGENAALLILSVDHEFLTTMHCIEGLVNAHASNSVQLRRTIFLLKPDVLTPVNGRDGLNGGGNPVFNIRTIAGRFALLHYWVNQYAKIYTGPNSLDNETLFSKGLKNHCNEMHQKIERVLGGLVSSIEYVAEHAHAMALQTVLEKPERLLKLIGRIEEYVKSGQNL